MEFPEQSRYTARMTRPRATSGQAQPRRADSPALRPTADEAPPWGPRAGIARDVEPATLAAQTARRLREDIVRNRFEPGERLTLDKLAGRYGVGTSPLREALFQVANDGLVRFEDHKGFVVAPLLRGELTDVTALRALVEVHAVQRSIELGGDAWEAAILTTSHRLGKAAARLEVAKGDDVAPARDAWERCHREFHYALCSACGSPWLLHFFGALYDPQERYRRYLWRYGERIRLAEDEHDRIRNAVLERNTAEAVTLLTEHFHRQAQRTAALRWPDDAALDRADAIDPDVRMARRATRARAQPRVG